MFDLCGMTFGFLKVTRRSEEPYHGEVAWVCQCECGKATTVPSRNLRKGHTKSCGCKRAELVGIRNTKHGHSVNRQMGLEYRIWVEMKQRCYNPKCNRYHTHGERGITVCERWRESFEAFLEDMGTRPSKGLSIERRDNNGNYESGNCYWATRKQQARNKRTTMFLTVNGETKPVSQWAEESGINYHTLRARIKSGWTAERAIRK